MFYKNVSRKIVYEFEYKNIEIGAEDPEISAKNHWGTPILLVFDS